MNQLSFIYFGLKKISIIKKIRDILKKFNENKKNLKDFDVFCFDNLDDVFTRQVARRCYHISKDWLKKLPASQKEHRSPTMFGELHVLKSLRLEAVKFDKI